MARARLLAALFAMMFISWTASVCPAQKIDNPLYKLWSNFKIGATKTMSGTISAGNFTIETEMTDKLVELTDDHAMIETVTTSVLNGQRHESPSRRHEVAAKIEKNMDWHEIGQEDVKAMGRTFHCKVVEARIAAPGRTDEGREADAKAWVDKEIPGGVVQMTLASNRGQAMTFVMKDFKAK